MREDSDDAEEIEMEQFVAGESSTDTMLPKKHKRKPKKKKKIITDYFGGRSHQNFCFRGIVFVLMGICIFLFMCDLAQVREGQGTFYSSSEMFQLDQMRYLASTYSKRSQQVILVVLGGCNWKFTNGNHHVQEWLLNKRIRKDIIFASIDTVIPTNSAPAISTLMSGALPEIVGFLSDNNLHETNVDDLFREASYTNKTCEIYTSVPSWFEMYRGSFPVNSGIHMITEHESRILGLNVSQVDSMLLKQFLDSTTNTMPDFTVMHWNAINKIGHATTGKLTGLPSLYAQEISKKIRPVGPLDSKSI
eukprot:TRINITY_DN4532_c0_g1_i3.p2 TRINITY_DN4532_c0_g1~~TRINITY_DN4532_c0_g1_i3.p2  ORF type:complete len:305 (-),score=43.74 TRINITY_DN4532_c0_g1_i3:1537-2451(-)